MFTQYSQRHWIFNLKLQLLFSWSSHTNNRAFLSLYSLTTVTRLCVTVSPVLGRTSFFVLPSVWISWSSSTLKVHCHQLHFLEYPVYVFVGLRLVGNRTVEAIYFRIIRNVFNNQNHNEWKFSWLGYGIPIVWIIASFSVIAQWGTFPHYH